MSSWDDYFSDLDRKRNIKRKSFQISLQRLEKLRNHKSTRRILYPEMNTAFDYVHSVYPFANIKQAMVYHVSKAILDDVGYRGIGGFYDIAARVVCVTDWSPKFSEIDGVYTEYTTDEVLCHELIHYGANFNNASSTRAVEEEIAYGKTIKYLRMKGRSDDFIIKHNMMPYLLSVVDRKTAYYSVLKKNYSEEALLKVGRSTIELLVQQNWDSIVKVMLENAYILGKKMIELYSGDEIILVPVKPTSRQLDIDDDF
jgi:hypothetical protein